MKKKVIVLGGSSGIGKATAERFAREGWQVIVAAFDLSQCLSVVKDLKGEGHFACEVDVRNDEHLNNLHQTVKEKFGDFYAWDNSIQVMLYGSVKACRILVPLLKEGGRIIHVTSIHYERVSKGSSAYGMAKAAITQFSRSLAVELA